MAQTATQRLMAVAIELEDERFTERRRFEQLHEDVSQRPRQHAHCGHTQG